MYEAGYKYRLYPTAEQKNYLARTFGCVRVVFNHALEARQQHYTDHGKGLSYGDTSALLTQWKRHDGYAWLSEVSCVPLQQALRHLQAAYTSFFKGIAKYPRFKSKRHRQSAEFTRSAFRLGGDPGRPSVYLAKCARALKIRWSLRLPEGSDPSTITVSKDPAGRYFISFRVLCAPKVLPTITKSIGLDMGLVHAVITSDGQKIDNPRYLKKALTRLKREQRSLCRKQKGSINREKQRLKVARLHARVADLRRDWAHKLTTSLVGRYDVICMESLSVKNMVKNHRLAQAIHDVAWGELRRQLRYKCRWYDRQLVEIDRFYASTKTCSFCSYVLPEIDRACRVWHCPSCGVVHDRDVNAAKNILGAGTALLASGLGVRPLPVLSGKAV